MLFNVNVLDSSRSSILALAEADRSPTDSLFDSTTITGTLSSSILASVEYHPHYLRQMIQIGLQLFQVYR